LRSNVKFRPSRNASQATRLLKLPHVHCISCQSDIALRVGRQKQCWRLIGSYLGAPWAWEAPMAGGKPCRGSTVNRVVHWSKCYAALGSLQQRRLCQGDVALRSDETAQRTIEARGVPPPRRPMLRCAKEGRYLSKGLNRSIFEEGFDADKSVKFRSLLNLASIQNVKKKTLVPYKCFS
jgi:hypothetical protein